MVNALPCWQTRMQWKIEVDSNTPVQKSAAADLAFLSGTSFAIRFTCNDLRLT
jgi:hypothetical protein